LSYSLQSQNINIEIYRTVILLVVLYGCETWSLTMREEHKARDLNRNVWIIFGPKREKVTGDWRTLHNVKLHDLYSLNTVVMTRSRRMRLVGHVACIGDRREA
jgi:hypothetical protein